MFLNDKQHARVTKTFYTDGSGMKLCRESSVMETAWAAVEVQPVVADNKKELEYKKEGYDIDRIKDLIKLKYTGARER